MLPISARARAVARAMQEQQLLARQMVLQQQAASAVAAASKTQREVRAAPPEPDTTQHPVARPVQTVTDCA